MADEMTMRLAWGRRCDCRKGHASASGRCNNRNVEDPTAKEGEPVYCLTCRAYCHPERKGRS